MPHSVWPSVVAREGFGNLKLGPQVISTRPLRNLRRLLFNINK
jgi:hypothetical protein